MTTSLSIFEQVISFFLFVGGTYAVGAAAALYTYYKTGAVFYKTGRSKSSSTETDAWYAGLKKTAFTPGSVGYALAWIVGYALFGYTLWRLWLTDPSVRESTLGMVAISFGLVHWVTIALTSYCLLGMENLFAVCIAQILNLGAVSVVLGIVWDFHATGLAVLLGPGISISIYAGFHLLALIVYAGLAYKNSKDTSSDSRL